MSRMRGNKGKKEDAHFHSSFTLQKSLKPNHFDFCEEKPSRTKIQRELYRILSDILYSQIIFKKLVKDNLLYIFDDND